MFIYYTACGDTYEITSTIVTDEEKIKQSASDMLENLNKEPIVSKESLKYQAIFYLAAICGLRCQEIVGLKWDNIDYDNRTFRVENAATEVKGKGTFLKDTKNRKSNRTLHMPDILYNTLKKLEKEQKEKRLKLGDKWIDGNYVFTQWNGEIMCVSTPSNWWRELQEAHSDIIPKVTFHGLRHTAATIMLQKGVPITDVSNALGHALTSTTLNIYAHIIEDSKKTAIDTSASAFIRPKAEKKKRAKK